MCQKLERFWYCTKTSLIFGTFWHNSCNLKCLRYQTILLYVTIGAHKIAYLGSLQVKHSSKWKNTPLNKTYNKDKGSACETSFRINFLPDTDLITGFVKEIRQGWAWLQLQYCSRKQTVFQGRWIQTHSSPGLYVPPVHDTIKVWHQQEVFSPNCLLVHELWTMGP